MNRSDYHKEYAKKNRKKLSEYSLDYYHKKNLKEYAKKHYQKNLLENRKKRRENNNKRRLEIIEFLGKKCVMCGYEDWRALQVDHINGGGNQDRKNIAHSQSALNTDVRKNPKKYQLLCANCNWIKRYDNKELYKKENI